jgi:deazaflavin-dependent oxidoreductase (nitroreductase family)
MTDAEGSSPDRPIDNPTPWVAKQIAAYLASDGEKSGYRAGVPLLLLTVQGRRSGLWKRTALICGRDGDSFVIVASLGGSPRHPSWYLNLVDNPRVRVQFMDRVFDADARTAGPEEKPVLWERMVGIYPEYADYQLKTDRQIPVVLLDPVAG